MVAHRRHLDRVLDVLAKLKHHLPSQEMCIQADLCSILEAHSRKQDIFLSQPNWHYVRNSHVLHPRLSIRTLVPQLCTRHLEASCLSYQTHDYDPFGWCKSYEASSIVWACKGYYTYPIHAHFHYTYTSQMVIGDILMQIKHIFPVTRHNFSEWGKCCSSGKKKKKKKTWHAIVETRDMGVLKSSTLAILIYVSRRWLHVTWYNHHIHWCGHKH